VSVLDGLRKLTCPGRKLHVERACSADRATNICRIWHSEGGREGGMNDCRMELLAGAPYCALSLSSTSPGLHLDTNYHCTQYRQLLLPP
jgi:hypothetical protein